MVRNFIYQKGNANKFWRIVITDHHLTSYWGDYQQKEKSKFKQFDTAEHCQSEADKLVFSKLNEGYEEIPLAFSEVSVFRLKKVWDAQQNRAEELTVDVEGSDDFLKIICTISSLRKLSLGGALSIPEEIGNLKQLKELRIRGDMIAKLPDSIGLLSSLSHLEIVYTAIRSLPESIGQLTQLSAIFLRENRQLQELPTTIGLLTNLSILGIEWNYHRNADNEVVGLPPLQLPESLGDLINLKELVLCGNGFTTLPKHIGQLKSLKNLDLGYNKLIEIPNGIYELPALETLKLRSNPILGLDRQLYRLEKLRHLELDHCPIKNVPPEIIEQGVYEIKNYLGGTFTIGQHTADPIPGIDKTEIVAQRVHVLDKFYRSVQKRIHTKSEEKELETLKHFLTGQTNEIPKASGDDHDYFEDIIQVLFSYHRWNAIDFRILAYITQHPSSFDDNREFYAWFEKQIKHYSDDKFLFRNVVEQLKKNGIEEASILQHSVKKIKDAALTGDKIPTSFGVYLLETFDSHASFLVQQGLRGDILELLVRYKNQELQPYIAGITKIKVYEDEDGDQHLPKDVFGILCKIHPEQYQSYVLEGIRQTNCQSCKAEAATILLDHCGPQHRDRVYQVIKKTLHYISEKKNKRLDSDYKFRWRGKAYTDHTPALLAWIFEHFGETAKPDILEYVEKTKRLDLDVISVAVKHLGQVAIDIAGEALNMDIDGDKLADHFTQTFALLSNLDYRKYYDRVWEIATSIYEKVGETACLALSRLDESMIIPKAKQLLTIKENHVRKAGALILRLLDSGEARQALLPVLEDENDEIRNIAVHELFQYPITLSIKEAKDRVYAAKKRGKLQKSFARWMNEKEWPAIYWVSGELVDTETIRFLLYRQKICQGVAVDFEARDIYPLLDKKSGADFAQALFFLMIKNGGFKDANHFVFLIIGLLGDERIVQPISQIAIKQSNVNACACLGNMESLDAAWALDKIMQTSGGKYPNVNEAAFKAFQAIAKKMNLDVDALRDKMIPDLGFADLKKNISLDGKRYTIAIDRDFDLICFNESGQHLKAISITDEQVNKEVKNIREQLRDTVDQFQYHLEHYLVAQRKYEVAKWKFFFLQQPLAYAFAQNFIWAIYEDDHLTGTFQVHDEKLQDETGIEIIINDQALLCLLHPVNIDKTLNDTWQQKWITQKITPPFQQLTRQVFLVTEDNKTETMSYEFYNHQFDAHVFKRHAEKLHWRKGSVRDSGGTSSYRKLFVDKDIEAFINTTDLYIDNNDSNTPMIFKELYFVKGGSVVIGDYIYDEPRHEEDDRLIPFFAVDPIVYSETIRDIKTILMNK